MTNSTFDEATNAEIARRLFAHVEAATTDYADGVMRYDASVYTDPALMVRERERIFRRDPIMVCHGSELAKPRDFLNMRMPNGYVLVVRQEDGSVKSFLNSCRHRGNVLTTEACGNQRVFSCQYHGWCYNTDGGLRSLSEEHTFGEVDKSELGLIELPTEERHGFVWVVLDPQAEIHVAESLGEEFDAVLGRYPLETYTCYRSQAFDQPVNWKVLLDAFLDNYHLRYTHAQSVGPYFYSNLMLSRPYGRHNQIIATKKSIDKVREEDPELVSIERYVTVAQFVWPNAQLMRQPDAHFTLFTFIPDPIDVARSRMEIRMLIPEPANTPELVALWDKNWDILMKTIVDEDLQMCRDLQLAMSSEGLQPLYLGKNEVVNQMFHREHARLMGAAEDGAVIRPNGSTNGPS